MLAAKGGIKRRIPDDMFKSFSILISIFNNLR